MIKRKPVFLGYALFYLDQPFMCSAQTVTKNTLYLKAHCLAKQNLIPMAWLQPSPFLRSFVFRDHQVKITHLWKTRDKRIQLRRVYAH